MKARTKRKATFFIMFVLCILLVTLCGFLMIGLHNKNQELKAMTEALAGDASGDLEELTTEEAYALGREELLEYLQSASTRFPKTNRKPRLLLMPGCL